MFLHLGLSLSLFILMSCSSGSLLKVESSPEGADVYVVRAGQAPAKIGQTPLSLNDKLIPEIFDTEVTLLIEKAEHETQTVLLPKTTLKTKGRLFAVLNEKKKPEVPVEIEGNKDQTPQINIITSQDSNEIASSIARAQHLLAGRNYTEAEILLIQMTNKFPQIYVAHDLLGNVYYLKKDLLKAAKSYRRSLDIWPNNFETKKVYDKITKMLGSRAEESRGEN
ncbi:MAG: tetratricopeptide repeat protein [Bacteriovoracaceae bacterium]|nr:tetratricopeptide repeat protein [Bacteriovoracaceae bacterium]